MRKIIILAMLILAQNIAFSAVLSSPELVQGTCGCSCSWWSPTEIYNCPSNSALFSETCSASCPFIGCSSSGSLNCACNPGYSNCNANAVDGCETPTSFNDNSCGACGLSCPQNYHCINSECIAPEDTARVAVEIGFFDQDTLKGFNNVITNRCKDIPIYCTSSLHESNYYYGNPPAYIDNKIDYAGYIKCSQSYFKNCNFLAENLLDLSISQPISNANSLDGCESDIRSSINACGACGVKCIDAPDENQCSAYLLNKDGGKSVCAYRCVSGVCSSFSLSFGQCSIPSIGASAECLSRNCIDSNSINNLDNSRMWCCQRATDCGYNGTCYSNNQALAEKINGKYYYCSNTQWLEISPKLNLSRMINYNHDINTLNNVYFSDLGLSNECSNSNFNACEKSSAYTFKYCFNYNIVFDGMFSIESDSSVPILVSEQELYNPYLKSSPIISPIDECTNNLGTEEGVMYCAK